MEIPLPGGDLVNPLSSQFGQLSLQDKAFLDAFNRQEQQELHGVPRPGPVDPNTLLGQLEQVSSEIRYIVDASCCHCFCIVDGGNHSNMVVVIMMVTVIVMTMVVIIVVKVFLISVP